MDNLQRIVDEHDWEASGEALAEGMLPLYRKLIELGADEATGELRGIDADFTLTRPEVDEVIDLLAEQIKGVSDTTRQKVQAIVDRQQSEGLSIPKVAKMINEQALLDSMSRSRTIARTETGMAYNMGTLLTYAKAGVTKVVVHDGDEDDDCKEADGQVWTIEEAQSNPLAHPNCQRAFSPIIDLD